MGKSCFPASLYDDALQDEGPGTKNKEALEIRFEPTFLVATDAEAAENGAATVVAKSSKKKKKKPSSDQPSGEPTSSDQPNGSTAAGAFAPAARSPAGTPAQDGAISVLGRSFWKRGNRSLRAAERHSQYLVWQLEWVYSPLHPLVGLQLYTVGDLREALEMPTCFILPVYEKALDILRHYFSADRVAMLADLEGKVADLRAASGT